jgi:hypothetical protein
MFRGMIPLAVILVAATPTVAYAQCSSGPTSTPSVLNDQARSLTLHNGENDDNVTIAATPPLPCNAHVVATLGSDVISDDGGSKLHASKMKFDATVTDAGDLISSRR